MKLGEIREIDKDSVIIKFKCGKSIRYGITHESNLPKIPGSNISLGVSIMPDEIELLDVINIFDLMQENTVSIEWLAKIFRNIRDNWNWMETHDFTEKFIERLKLKHNNFNIEEIFRNKMNEK